MVSRISEVRATYMWMRLSVSEAVHGDLRPHNITLRGL